MRLPGLLRSRIDQWLELYETNLNSLAPGDTGNSMDDGYQAGYAAGIYDQLTELGYTDYVRTRIASDINLPDRQNLRESHKKFEEGYSAATRDVKRSLPFMPKAGH